MNKSKKKLSPKNAKYIPETLNTSFDAWYLNEQEVEDITLDIFYKPHTLTLLASLLLWLLYIAWSRDNEDDSLNIYHGILSVSAILVVPISLILFPNGPFIRPHPGMWRICFGITLWYFFFLVFILFLNMHQVQKVLYYMDPALAYAQREVDVMSYAEDCSNITWNMVLESIDIFAFAHFWGWAMKAIMIRNYGICWTISVTWELTEMQFEHILPNFAECWWDHWILDVLVCNGGGIWLGMQVTKYLEMRQYHWESVLDIDSNTKKLKRCILQFTPESWSPINWIRDGKRNLVSRAISLFFLMALWQLVELNTFFSKHTFQYPGSHILCWGRILFIGLTSGPAIKQYYTFATDSRCKRLGNHAWLFLAVIFMELIVNIKFGYAEFNTAKQTNIAQWIFIMMAGSIFGLSLCLYTASRENYEDGELSEDELHPGETNKLK